MTRIGATWNLTLKLEANTKSNLTRTIAPLRREMVRLDRKSCSLKVVEELDFHDATFPGSVEEKRNGKVTKRELEGYKYERRGGSLTGA